MTVPFYNLDHHKLHHHPEAVQRWKRGKTIYPLYVEISPTGRCNHRCIFCAYDHLGYQPRRLDAARTKAALRELGARGTKACLFAGDGEPLLHPGFPAMVRAARASGIDVGIFTNASLLTRARAEEILPDAVFLRCSLNGGDRENYARIHQVSPGQFDTVIRNLETAVDVKRRRGLGVTLGVQFVMLPENIRTAPSLAKRLKSVGVDYLALKPFVLHPEQITLRWEGNFDLEEIEDVLREVEAESTAGYRVIARRNFLLQHGERSYERCLGLPFFAFILSDGGVYTCGPHFGNPAHCYGNIHEQTFSELWEGPRRREILTRIENDWDCRNCTPNCRVDAVNRFLWELRHPPEHVNFI